MRFAESTLPWAARSYGSARDHFSPDSCLGIACTVGGVSDENFGDYAKGGIKAFGLGSSLYKPGMSPDEIGQRASTTIAAYEQAFGV